MDLIDFGRVTKPHGLAGEVVIMPFSRRLDNLLNLSTLYLRMKNGANPTLFTILEQTPLTDRAIVSLGGIDTRDKAEAISGATVLIDPGELAATDEGEYYWFDLKGLVAYDTDGGRIGTVVDIMEGGAHSLLVVQGSGGESLVPMIDAFVQSIDIDHGKIVLTPPPGLIE